MSTFETISWVILVILVFLAGMVLMGPETSPKPEAEIPAYITQPRDK